MGSFRTKCYIVMKKMQRNHVRNYKEIERRLARNEIPDIFWDWAANPNGGFMFLQCMRKYSEQEGCTLFLQLEQDKLCIKMEVDSDDNEER